MNKFLLGTLVTGLLATSLSAKGIYDKMLREAIVYNNIKKIDLYLGKGANLNSLKYRDLEYTNLKTITYIIKKGYDVSDKEEDCLLSRVMQDRYKGKDTYEIVKLLMDNGASPTCKNKDEYYPTPVIEYVLRNGVRFASESTLKAFNLIVKNAKSDLNSNLLYEAFNNNTNSRFKVIKILVENGIDINQTIKEDNGITRALELAVRYNSLKIVKYLVNHGANINQVTYSSSPIDKAHAMERDEIELFLVEHGARYHKYSDLN